MKKIALPASLFVLVLVFVIVIRSRSESSSLRGVSEDLHPARAVPSSTGRTQHDYGNEHEHEHEMGAPAVVEPMHVPVQAVDLQGNPLDNMIPIAALQPNAFEKPLVQGMPTDKAGKSFLTIPLCGQRVFVRAWDPSLQMFSNNYLEITPESGAQTDLLELIMVPGASLDALLLLPDKSPAANADVAIMMVHPTEGPWWPDKAQTDAKGAVHFPALPPGKFLVKIKVSGGLTKDIPEVILLPRSHVDLGPVVLEGPK